MNDPQIETMRLRYQAAYAEDKRLAVKASEKATRLDNGTLLGRGKATYILSIDALRRARLDLRLATDFGGDDAHADAMLKILSDGKTTLSNLHARIINLEDCVNKARVMLADLGVTVRDIRRKG